MYRRGESFAELEDRVSVVEDDGFFLFWNVNKKLKNLIIYCALFSVFMMFSFFSMCSVVDENFKAMNERIEREERCTEEVVNVYELNDPIFLIYTKGQEND